MQEIFPYEPIAPINPNNLQTVSNTTGRKNHGRIGSTCYSDQSFQDSISKRCHAHDDGKVKENWCCRPYERGAFSVIIVQQPISETLSRPLSGKQVLVSAVDANDPP